MFTHPNSKALIALKRHIHGKHSGPHSWVTRKGEKDWTKQNSIKSCDPRIVQKRYTYFTKSWKTLSNRRAQEFQIPKHKPYKKRISTAGTFVNTHSPTMPLDHDPKTMPSKTLSYAVDFLLAENTLQKNKCHTRKRQARYNTIIT